MRFHPKSSVFVSQPSENEQFRSALFFYLIENQYFIMWHLYWHVLIKLQQYNKR